MKQSNYSKYLKERENVETLETEHSFCTYKILEDYVYIIDLYVQPEFRKSKKASELAKKVEKIAKNLKINKLLGSVDVTANNSTESTAVLISYGFKILNLSGANMIYFEKIIN